MYTSGNISLPQVQFLEIRTYIHNNRYHREKIHTSALGKLEEEHKGVYSNRGVLRNDQRKIRHSPIEKGIQGIYVKVWKA